MRAGGTANAGAAIGASVGTDPPQAQPVLPWDEGDEDDGADDAALAIAGLDDRSREIAWLEQLVGLWQRLRLNRQRSP